MSRPLASTSDPVRLLLVEDEEANRFLVRAVLYRAEQHIGREFRLIEAADLRQARSALSDHDVDVYLLDVMLPDGSGLELAAEAHERPGPRPAIIVLSAAVHDTEKQAAFSAGADEFIGKPFRSGELIAALGRAIADLPSPIGGPATGPR